MIKLSVYLILLLLIFSFCFCILDKVKGSINFKKFLFVSFIIILIVIASMKTKDTTWDTSNYVNFYNNISPITNYKYTDYSTEPGVSIIAAICKQFSASSHLFFFVISLITLSFYGVVIWKYSPYPFLSLFIYYAWFYVNREIIIIRYGASCAIMLYSLVLLSKEKVFKSFVFGVIAFLFHYTALTYLLLLVLWYMFSKLKPIKTMQVIILITFPLAIIGVSILWAVAFIYRMNILPGFLQVVFSKGFKYLNTEESRSVRACIMYLPIFYFYAKCNKTEFINNMYFIFLAAFFLLFELTAAAEFARIPYMYITLIVILLPFFIKNTSKKTQSLIYAYTFIIVLYNFIRVNTGVLTTWLNYE